LPISRFGDEIIWEGREGWEEWEGWGLGYIVLSFAYPSLIVRLSFALPISFV